MRSRDRLEAGPPDDTLAGEALGERCAALARRVGVEEVALELARARARERLLSEPRRIVQLGRYIVIDRIGSGGMGVVYAAFDPQLDRKIALKVLHARTRSGTPNQRTRLLREAQSLARLTHPNVVAIHDAGTFDTSALERDGPLVEPSDSHIFIAMEYVDGLTLTRWLGEPRTLRDMLEVVIQAGRGLAAAHAAGLVHRDFKPDNVMVSSDPHGTKSGVRVRVMDFGLARTDLGPDSSTAVSVELNKPDASTVAPPSTTDGAVVGTPAYMAPEQHLGLPTDARSDQFAFCVVLWEAIYGRRPFVADSLPALALSVTSGRREPPPAGARVPRWLRRACERGLSTDPADRFASMSDLLATLERGLERARTGRVAVVAAAVVVAGLAVLGARARDEARRADECVELGVAIADIWPGPGDSARAAMRAALAEAAGGDASVTAARVDPWLDQWSSAWTTAREQTCRAHQVEDTWDDGMRARADECLAERRSELAALVAELGGADADLSWRAVGAAAGLTRVEPCADAAMLTRRPALPSESLDAISAVRELLAHALVLSSAAKYDEGLVVARQALADADSIGWAPLRAEALLRVGVLQERDGDVAAAEATLVRAYVEAGRAAAPETVADAALNLVFVVGAKASRHHEARVWGLAGEIAVAAAEPAGPGVRTAGLWNSLAQVHMDARELPEARAMHERVLAIREDVLGPTHPAVATSLNNLGNVLHAMGDNEGARGMYERALAIREQVFGPDHPDFAVSLESMAHAERAAGRLAEALAGYGHAVAITERALGPEHPKLASMLNNLGSAQLQLGERAASRSSHARSLAIVERAYGPDSLEASRKLAFLANVDMQEGDFASSERSYRRVLAIQENKLGSDNIELVISLVNIAKALMRRGELEEAKALTQRALELREARLGSEHTALVSLLEQLADIELELVARGQGRLDDAIAWLGQAERICLASSDPLLAQVRSKLAIATSRRPRAK
jgi:eukaryotic-like serine/threonine-protein kinase